MPSAINPFREVLDKEGAIAMELRFSPVHDDQMESGVNGLPSIALGKRDRQDLSSAVALLENTIMPLSGGDITCLLYTSPSPRDS